MDAWPILPDAIRSAMMALVQSGTCTKEHTSNTSESVFRS